MFSQFELNPGGSLPKPKRSSQDSNSMLQYHTSPIPHAGQHFVNNKGIDMSGRHTSMGVLPINEQVNYRNNYTPNRSNSTGIRKEHHAQSTQRVLENTSAHQHTKYDSPHSNPTNMYFTMQPEYGASIYENKSQGIYVNTEDIYRGKKVNTIPKQVSHSKNSMLPEEANRPFKVASQHDALLNELIERGQKATIDMNSPSYVVQPKQALPANVIDELSSRLKMDEMKSVSRCVIRPTYQSVHNMPTVCIQNQWTTPTSMRKAAAPAIPNVRPTIINTTTMQVKPPRFQMPPSQSIVKPHQPIASTSTSSSAMCDRKYAGMQNIDHTKIAPTFR